MAKSRTLVAKQSFTANRRVVTAGQAVASNDPIVAGREHLFREFEAPTVEQATARPGEARNVRKAPAKRKAPAEQATAAPGEADDEKPADA